MNGSDDTFEESGKRFEREWAARVKESQLFNDSAVDRIVTKVGKPPLKRYKFVKELERVARNYLFRHEVNNQPPEGEVSKWLAGNISAARRLRKLHAHLPGNDHEFLEKLLFIAGHDRHDISQVRHAIEAIPLVEAIYGKLLRDKSYSRDRIGSKFAAAEHWLIGEALPRIYEKHFGKKFGYSRDKEAGVISGPSIRFILEVLSIMKVDTPRDGKPFGPDAVEYYLRSSGH